MEFFNNNKTDERVKWLKRKISILQNNINADTENKKITDMGKTDTLINHLRRYTDELAKIYDSKEFQNKSSIEENVNEKDDKVFEEIQYNIWYGKDRQEVISGFKTEEQAREAIQRDSELIGDDYEIEKETMTWTINFRLRPELIDRKFEIIYDSKKDKKESLKEDFNASIPEWLKRHLNRYVSLKSYLTVKGVDLTRVKFVEQPIPESTKDVVALKKQNKLPIFNFRYSYYIPGFNDNDYATWGSKQYKYIAMRDILENAYAFGYIDLNDPDNLTTEKRKQRSVAQNGTINRGTGQYKLFDTEYRASYYDDNSQYHPSEEITKTTYRWLDSNDQDKSGYNLPDPNKYKNILDNVGLNNYSQRLDKYYNKLVELKSKVLNELKRVNKKSEYSLDNYDIKSEDNLSRYTISEVMNNFSGACDSYKRLLGSVDRIINSEATKDEKELRIHDLFDGSSTWGSLVNLRDYIDKINKYFIDSNLDKDMDESLDISEANDMNEYDNLIMDMARSDYELGSVYSANDYEEFKKIISEDEPSLLNKDEEFLSNLWDKYFEFIDLCREDDEEYQDNEDMDESLDEIHDLSRLNELGDYIVESYVYRSRFDRGLILDAKDIKLEDIQDEYDDSITQVELDNVIKAIENNIKNIKIYNNDHDKYIELNDDHTLLKIEYDNIDPNVLEYEYPDKVNEAIEKFKLGTGQELYLLGRSGRHACVELNYENIVNYNKLKEVQKELEQEIIDYFNNAKIKPLKEDTVKQNGKWVNKGKEGTHGKFTTKKAANAQRKAMFANGYKENINLNEFIAKNPLKQAAKFAKKHQKGKGWFVNPNAGDVEKGNAIFNSETSINSAINSVPASAPTGMGEDMEEDKPKLINIKEALNNLDKEDYKDLFNIYEAYALNEQDKKELANLLFEKDVTSEKVYEFFNSKLSLLSQDIEERDA